MKVYKYKSYAAYKKAQVKANKDKLALSWVRPDVVNLICECILAANPAPTFGLCHGTRRGEEQRMFSDRLKCPVLGTEIADTAARFSNTIEWDFHRVKPEWEGACDFVYSNSLDHAKNPERALDAWISCLKPTTGVLAIEWVELLGRGRIKRATSMDPFSATADEVASMMLRAGCGTVSQKLLQIPDRRSWLLLGGEPFLS
jgi:hypothetical protein